MTEIKSGNNTVGYTYDGKRRVKSVSLNGTNNYVTYTYNGEHTNSETVQATMANGTVAKSVKNFYGNVTQTTCGSRSVTNTYNTDQQLTKSVDSVSGTTTYSYDTKGNVTAVNATDCTESYTYDAVDNTLDSKKITIGSTTHTYTYAYKSTASKALDSISVDGKTVRPATDALGRLTREDNVSFGKTITWSYDNNGNIIARYEYALTAKPTSELHLLSGTCISYAYDDNSDRLLSYNGEAFVYDSIGNPTTYRGKAATWAYGRQLTAYNGNTFTYDARGRRMSKNGITFTYDSSGNLIKQSNGLEFFYDHTGVFAVKYNGSTYFYRKDAQGNVTALLDNSGAVVVRYKYDAWGKCLTTVVDSSATEIANLNPFRYRSYYYDTETGFYFLKTRYYDPEIGRFMTIDDLSYLDPESINGLNLYAYCLNNPVMMTDETGCLPNWLKWLIGGAVIIGLGIATAFIGNVTGVIFGAAFYGALTGAVSGALVSGIVGGITGGWQGFWDGVASGFMSGAIIGGATGALSAGLNYITGTVNIDGSAQVTKTFFHRMASNVKAGKMAIQVGRYSKITLDRSLKRGGLIGRKMPDVVGKARWGKDLAVEVVSKSQTFEQMENKLIKIQAYNPNLARKVIRWAGWIGKWLF